MGNFFFSRHTIFKRPQYILLTLLAIFAGYFLFSGDVDQTSLFSLPVITQAYSLFDSPLKLQESLNDVEPPQWCKIPELDVNDSSVLKILDKEEMEPLNCAKKIPLLFDSFIEPYPRLMPVEDLSTMRVVKKCCYRAIKFEGIAQNPEFSKKCGKISLRKETKIPRDHEFISIECVLLDRTDDQGTRHWEKKIVDMHTFPRLQNTNYFRAAKDNFNVIVVGLDSLSRMNFQRTMPETYGYVMGKLEGVEMEGLNKIGDNTFPNVGVLLTNEFVSDDYSQSCAVNKSDKACNLIWQQFAAKNYQTLYYEDETTMSILNHLYFNPNTTHYYYPPYLTTLDKYLGHEQRIAANMCFGPWMAAQKTFDYAKKIATLMKKYNLNYFHFGWSTSITHDYIKGGQLMDQEISSLLKWYQHGGYLKNTILFLMSDHGMRIGEIRGNYQGQMEDRLPFLYVALPQTFKQKYPRALSNLKSNSKQLSTVWDLHQTLRHILEPEKLESGALSQFQSTSTKGISLFQPIPPSRTCEDAGVPLLYCACNIHQRPVPLNDTVAVHVAGEVIKKLNSVLKVEPVCAQLTLGKMLKASRITFKDYPPLSPSAAWEAYKVTFKTVPTWTTFDAIVTRAGGAGESEWTPQNIGRYTWYWLDNKAACLGKWREEISLIMYYCYCKEYT